MDKSKLLPTTVEFLNDGRRSHNGNKPSLRRLALAMMLMACVAFPMFSATRGGWKFLNMVWNTEGHGCPGASHRNASSLVSTLPTHRTLPSGDKIPTVALGVWQAGRGEVGGAVKAALEAGYRHIDGAWVYGNEGEVGKAIQESGVPREEIFLTSKLWNTFHAPENIESTLTQTLSSLQTSYLDLYLIHWPVAFKEETVGEERRTVLDRDLTDDPYPTWKKLEEMVDKGKIRNIGVSNFNIRRFENLTSNPLKYRPAVNQVELSFWNPQPELLKWSHENDVLLEAYSPLGSNQQVKESLEVPEVKAAAAALGITAAQVIISWHVQRGTVVLPKSVHADRVRENFQVFTLPPDVFEKIETAAISHPPRRLLNPSKAWGLDFDIFE